MTDQTTAQASVEAMGEVAFSVQYLEAFVNYLKNHEQRLLLLTKGDFAENDWIKVVYDVTVHEIKDEKLKNTILAAINDFPGNPAPEVAALDPLLVPAQENQAVLGESEGQATHTHETANAGVINEGNGAHDHDTEYHGHLINEPISEPTI